MPLNVQAQPGGHPGMENMTPQGMAQALLQMGRFQEAASIFSRLLDEDPGNSPAARGLVVASLKGKHLEDAGARLKELITKHPGQSSLNLGMGLFHHFSGNSGEAEKFFNQSLKLDSNNALTLNALAAMHSEKRIRPRHWSTFTKRLRFNRERLFFTATCGSSIVLSGNRKTSLKSSGRRSVPDRK